MKHTFAGCELDTEQHRLLRHGKPVAVEPQVFDLILLLAENSDRVVTRDEIVAKVWQGRIVSESAISARIAAARKAVGDDGKRQAVIRTIARRGLQMATEVTADTIPRQVSATSETLSIRYTRNANGQSLAYTVTGRGPPVVLVGSLMTDIELEWHVPVQRKLFDAIMADHSLLRFDPLGSGQSDTPLDMVDFDLMADDICAVMDAAGIDRAIVMSETGGTLPAIHFAAKHPKRVSRLAAVGGYAEGRTRRAPTPEPDALRAIMAEGWSTPDSSFIKAYVKAYFPEIDSVGLNDIAGLVQNARSKESMLKLRDASNDASIAHLLQRIECPTLVIHGRRDGVHPLSQGRMLAAGIRRAELVVLETANNIPVPGSPVWDIYIETLMNFFAGAPPSATP